MTEASKRDYSISRDEEERERLLTEQLPQVRYIARRIHERLPRHVLLEDLVHAGVVGLIDALQKYDTGKKVQFSSYAKFRIRGAILDSLREMDWSPRDLRRKARRLEEAHHQLRSSLGRNPSEPELAAEVGMDLRGLQLLLGEISGLEVGSLRVESSAMDRKKTCASICPMTPKRRRCFLLALGDEATTGPRHRGIYQRKERQVLALYYLRGAHDERSRYHPGNRGVGGVVPKFTPWP